MNCVFYSLFDCCIISTFKESLCFLHWILHYFLWLKPLALFGRYYSLELEIYTSFSSKSKPKTHKNQNTKSGTGPT